MSNFKKGQHVQLTKEKANEIQLGILMEGYALKGYLDEDIEVGKHIRVLRYERNGIRIGGLFETSAVIDIEANKIFTQNSIWTIEKIQ